ncbi:UNVERIFIED_CONTAM: hypothetical protein RMT77_016832 [Armadillidium vulgare]
MVQSSSWQPWGIPLIIIVLLLLSIIILLIVRWYIRKPMYHGPARIDGKTVVITGGNTGIGKETAKDLIKRGGRVILLCRDPERGRVASDEIKEELGTAMDVYQLDLSSLDSVRECATQLKQKEPRIDILINNAGIMMTPQLETKDGFELQFGTNHVGHFLLTLLLLDNIKRASPSRIINVSSLAHIYGRMHWEDLQLKNNYRPDRAYTQSKLANILFTKILAEKLKGTGISTYALHPGLVHTELYQHFRTFWGGIGKSITNLIGSTFYKSPLLGAQTTIFCAVDEAIADHTGRYYSGCKEKLPSTKAQNMDDAERLWSVSLELVGLQDFNM